jgi:hypothetical protein
MILRACFSSRGGQGNCIPVLVHTVPELYQVKTRVVSLAGGVKGEVEICKIRTTPIVSRLLNGFHLCRVHMYDDLQNVVDSSVLGSIPTFFNLNDGGSLAYR